MMMVMMAAMSMAATQKRRGASNGHTAPGMPGVLYAWYRDFRYD